MPTPPAGLVNVVLKQYNQGDAALCTDHILDKRTGAAITTFPTGIVFEITRPDGRTDTLVYPGQIAQLDVATAQVSYSLDVPGDYWGFFKVPSGYGQHTTLFHLVVANVSF